MMKTLIEIAKEQGAIVLDGIDFMQLDEAQLIATINAVNAQSEPVGEIVCDARTGHTVNIFTGDKPYPNIGTKLYTAPQTLPPEWAEYVGRLERTLEWYGNENNWFISEDKKVSEINAGNAFSVAQQALASKPKG